MPDEELKELLATNMAGLNQVKTETTFPEPHVKQALKKSYTTKHPGG